jgi:anti-sigma-K factor RskA
MTDHAPWDELAAGFALHALEPDEQARFVTHLEGCGRCAESLADHELIAAQLGSLSQSPDVATPPSWETVRAAVIGSSDTPAATDLDARRRRVVTRRVLAAAAALVLVVGGAAVAVRLVDSGGTSCSTSTGCHRVDLDAAGGRTLASLVVRDNLATVTPSGMPPAPAGKEYVLWQVPRAGTPVPIGEFTAGTGAAGPSVVLNAPFADTAAFAVSLESASGAPPPTPSNMLATGTTG